ncbi:hypothetical protein EBR43_09045 [bacterium]|jgi:hypothetical protein|nr:hypothetical protein [bacterium]
MSLTGKLTVEIVKDYDYSKYLVEGTVLQSCKEHKRHFTGIFASMWGSYIVKVPKQYCKIIV